MMDLCLHTGRRGALTRAAAVSAQTGAQKRLYSRFYLRRRLFFLEYFLLVEHQEDPDAAANDDDAGNYDCDNRPC